MNYEVVIGLEVHSELLTNTKIFCSCPAKFGGEVNTHVCPVCSGLPGVLPVLNRQVVEYALIAGLALNCEIPPVSKFDRKNYFYPDLPKAYQVSQFDQPIAVKGHLEIEVNGQKKIIGITRIHMEEDAGKLVHAGSDRLAGSSYSLVDYNRAGVPLIEIVSEPDMRSAAEAKAYMEKLRDILVYTGICDGKMEEGSLRCDVNISIMEKGAKEFGTRVEIKNLNSFKSIQRAVDYEVDRQIDEVERGRKIIQETRLWDENKGFTSTMRVKEEADDYRYFPEPDLVSIVIKDEWLEKLKASMPELPDVKKNRYINEFGLSEYDSSLLVNSLELSKFFEECVKIDLNPKTVTNWLTGNIAAYLNERKLELVESKITPEFLSTIINLIEKGTISAKIAREVMFESLDTGKSPLDIVKSNGVTQMGNADDILVFVKEAISENPKQVEEFLGGKDKLITFFVGQIMKKTKGRADPKILNELLLSELKNMSNS